MDSPPGLTRLLPDWSAYRWAFDHVLPCLVPVDIMRLTISMLEHGDDRYAEFTHWLMDGDTPGIEHDDEDSLIEAAKFECWVAADMRVHRRKRDRLDSLKGHLLELRCPPRIDTARRREMALDTINDYRYESRRDVIVALAKRGDVAAVACTSLHESKRGYESHQEPLDTAFRAAAYARQYHILDWIAQHVVDCDDCYPRELPTVESMIAHHGDLGLLQELFAHGDRSKWDTTSMIEGAAAGGHVEVVEWILHTFHLAIKPEWFFHAAVCGQLEMLQWLWAHYHMRNTSVSFLVAAAQHGYLGTVQWLKQNLDEAAWKMHQPDAVAVAHHAGELATVFFLLDGGSVQLDARWIYSMKKSTSVDTINTCLSRTNPAHVDQRWLLRGAALASNLGVIKYLVLQRGYWSRVVFREAVNTPSGGLSGLHIGQFLYPHAKQRARELHTSLEAQIDFSGIEILLIASKGYAETARWLAECVPEVDTGETLVESTYYGMGRFPETVDAQRAILACLRARPTQCLCLEWLPQWSRSAYNFEAFSALVGMGHPGALHLWIELNADGPIRDSRFLTKILAVERLEIKAFNQIVALVAGLGAEGVLNSIYSRWHDGMHSMERLSWEEAARRAIQHGHVGILMWFHDRGLLVPESERHKDRMLAHNSVAAKLIRKAAKHDRVECLDWLLKTFGATSYTLGEALRDGVEYYSGRVVRWLLRAYAPHDLRLSSDDVRRALDAFGPLAP